MLDNRPIGEEWALKNTRKKLDRLCRGNFLGLKWAMAITEVGPKEKAQQSTKSKKHQRR